MTPEQFHKMKHTESCDRGSADTFKKVYGTPDPDCPKCKASDQIHLRAAKRMFG